MTGTDDPMDGLLALMGQPVPCEICRTPTATADLTETRVPGAVIFDGTIVVDRIIWVCPRCPLPTPTEEP